MIVEYVRYTIPVAEASSFLAAYETASRSLEASPHCLGYELSRCEEEPTSFILRIEWDSTEGHLQGFRRGPEFPDFLAAVRPFVSRIEEMRHYAVSSSSRSRGAP